MTAPLDPCIEEEAIGILGHGSRLRSAIYYLCS